MPWGKHKGICVSQLSDAYLAFLMRFPATYAPNWAWLLDSIQKELRARGISDEVDEVAMQLCEINEQVQEHIVPRLVDLIPVDVLTRLKDIKFRGFMAAENTIDVAGDLVFYFSDGAKERKTPVILHGFEQLDPRPAALFQLIESAMLDATNKLSAEIFAEMHAPKPNVGDVDVLNGKIWNGSNWIDLNVGDLLKQPWDDGLWVGPPKATPKKPADPEVVQTATGRAIELE